MKQIPVMSGLLSQYPWWWADRVMATWTVIGASVLLYYTLGGNGVTCSSDQNLKNAFVGAQVVMFNQVCEEHHGLFFLMLTVSFTARWWRTILGWEAGQEARVILKKKRGTGPDERPWPVRLAYHKTLIQNTVLYLLEVVFIISQNLWVFLSVVAGNQLATYYYLIRSPADQERDGAHHQNGDTRLLARMQKQTDPTSAMSF